MKNLFENISPFDYRYYGRSKAKEVLVKYLSEEAYAGYRAKVEAALAQALADKGVCSREIADEISKACETITADEIYKEEDRIKHDIRGLANSIRAKVSDKAKPYVHFSSTSYDIVDPANMIRYKEFVSEVLIPKLLELEKIWIELSEREKNTIQVGRTHGQHAEPITFGFTMAEYVDRLGNRIVELNDKYPKLRGKMSGAVGSYNASSLLVGDPLDFERTVMAKLGLKPALYSNQIVTPEPILDLVHAAVSCFGVLANFADDMRNLQRTEIGEVGEFFGTDQVGSSTMPQKKNPINFENVKSFWKQIMPRIVTVYMDQISEHQRDLTNSASARFIPEIFAGLYLTVSRLIRVSKNLQVDTERMMANFNLHKDLLAAEPLYMLLAAYDHPDAHSAVKKLAMQARTEKKPLQELALADKALAQYINQFKPEQREIIMHPETYLGLAPKKAQLVCDFWRKELKI
jgi:adenylosuccinate lyase